ncbi:MAG TPA: prohibitin family protein [Capsulimonadaceae bacterium]|jgi:regulator of protease activity HflC (stomatin/prohibitin superfamily)
MLLAIVGLIVFVVSFFIRVTPAQASVKQLVKVVGVVLFFFGLITESFFTVPAGYRGILMRFGAPVGDLKAGAHFKVPVMETVEMMEVRTQKADAKGSAASQDLQVVTTDVAVNYHLDGNSVGKIYSAVGDDTAIRDRIIHPATQEVLKSIVARYTAEQLIRQRDQVKTQVDDALKARLLAYNIIVEPNGVSLTNFEFSQQFNDAIESKQVAQQGAEQQKYVLAKAQMEAQTEIAKANGIAQANRIKAQALNSEGGQKVLAQSWIDKWDGHLPTVSSSGGGQILDLRDLMAGNAKAQ